MLIKQCNIPDLSNPETRAVSYFLTKSLIFKSRDTNLGRYAPLLARLIDKAAFEYSQARDCIILEVSEGECVYEEVLKSGEGQYLFTHTIINHLENCINAIARIYKILQRIDMYKSQGNIMKFRNNIEHMDERIASAVEGSSSLNISEDSLVIEIASKDLKAKTVKVCDIAEEIKKLYKMIFKIIGGK